MLKEFIEHIQKTTQPLIREVDGSTFAITSDGTAEEIRPSIDRLCTLVLNSLDALVKLARTEAVHMEKPLYITVPDHLTVLCFGQPQPDAWLYRQDYYRVKATDVPGFKDGFRDQESAIIELRSRFVSNAGTEYLLDLLSRMETENGVTVKDNGVAQTVETRKGASLKQVEPVRPRVALRPYRTFQEVEQPESEFLLRVNGKGEVGLFEADGGMWKLKARETIKVFLEEQLSDLVESEDVYIAL